MDSFLLFGPNVPLFHSSMISGTKALEMLTRIEIQHVVGFSRNNEYASVSEFPLLAEIESL